MEELKDVGNNVTKVASVSFIYYIDRTPNVPYRGLCPGDKVRWSDGSSASGTGVVLGRLLCFHDGHDDGCLHTQHPETDLSRTNICVMIDNRRQGEQFTIFENE
jgi:hypothetical protein